MKAAPEFVVDARNPVRIRVKVRDDVFAMVADAIDVGERASAISAALTRLAARLRRRTP